MAWILTFSIQICASIYSGNSASLKRALRILFNAVITTLYAEGTSKMEIYCTDMIIKGQRYGLSHKLLLQKDIRFVNVRVMYML